MKDNQRDRPSEREAIEARAAAWLAQRDAGFGGNDEAEFTRWRAEDSRHDAAITRLESTWAVLQQLRDFRPEAAMHPDRDLLRRRQPAARIVPFPAIATAALAACCAIAVLWWWPAQAPRDAAMEAQHYATTTDGYQRVVLRDGSLLELNADTEVNVHFTPAERRVRLLRGEAHFTVAKNPARPFSVSAGLVAVRAIGTAFNVRMDAADVEVVVTEGRVVLEAAKNDPADSSDSPRPPSEPSLVPLPELVAGERTVIPAKRLASAPPMVEKVAADVLRETLAWQGPRLVFVDTPLADVVAQFNRRNQVQLELADAELRNISVGGSFRAENLEAFVRLLSNDQDIAIERPDPERIVLRKARASAPPR